MRRPLIGITTYHREGEDRPRFFVPASYIDAVRECGGRPVLLPPGDEDPGALLDDVDGVLLCGGGDLDPARFGGSSGHGAQYSTCPERDAFELALIEACIERRAPTLAICRGLQVLNVALGGTLRQDIGTDEHWHGFHEIHLDPASLLASVVGADRVHHCHCVHHQAIDDVAPSLRVVGHDLSDGLTHAVESTEARWVLGVQWHPEDTALDDAQQQLLFDALVVEARTPLRA